MADSIDDMPIESVEVRSPLTCEVVHLESVLLVTVVTLQLVKWCKRRSCRSCCSSVYWRTRNTVNLAGTFHVGGVAGNISEENQLITKFDGVAEIEDLKIVKGEDQEGKEVNIVISRTSEIKLIDKKTKNVLSTNNIPYGSILNIENGATLKKGQSVCSWDPFNGVIVSEFAGKIVYETSSKVLLIK